jgi:peptidoglycan/xylan/chitin deacetylase (PgdA/CDA1 family)
MWPNGKKCAVMLGFDVDAESLWISMNMDSPTPLSRGAYGARVGTPRILDLLDRYSLPATFFVPADTARRHPTLVQEIHARGHEIGHHGDVHESPRELDPDAERRVLETGLETLEKLVGERPRGYRSPDWDLSPNSARLLEEYGFQWDSSLMADDFQLAMLKDGERGTGIVEIPVAWELDDAPHFLFRFYPKYLVGLSAPSKVLEIWTSEFDGAYASEGVFVLTMHPQISGRYHRVVMLEELLQYILGHPGVWFATGSQLVDEWLKQPR